MKFEKRNLDPVMITINEVEYPAILNFRALSELEKITGKSFHETIEAFTTTGISSLKLMEMVYVSLKAGGVDITLDDFMDIDYDIQLIGHFSEKMTELIVRCIKTEDIIVDDDSSINKKKPAKRPTKEPTLTTT